PTAGRSCSRWTRPTASARGWATPSRRRHGGGPGRGAAAGRAGPRCPPALPEAPLEPRVEETAGKRSQMATYQDLLRTFADADAFEALATTVPLRVEPGTGAVKELGPPGLYQRLSDSPDGEHLLVHQVRG